MLKTKSCAASQISVLSNMIGCKNANLTSAISVLSGGVLSKGSTCGVVASAALGIALIMDDENESWGYNQQKLLHKYLEDYHNNFRKEYDSTFCRDRTQVNLRSKFGILKYVFLPNKITKCISHCKGSMQYVTDRFDTIRQSTEELTEVPINVPHCAAAVMQTIRERTSIGDELLERISIALDGGVGLQGGACGALSGALVALNIGKSNHMIYTPSLKKKESKEFAIRLIDKFIAKNGSIECATITSKNFQSLDDFIQYRSTNCDELIDFLVDEVSNFLQ